MQQYEAVSQLNSERYARLERAQVLVNQFWETYEELNPWIEETQALISQLPPPAIDHEQLKQQQDDMRVKRMQGLPLLSISSALSRRQGRENLFLQDFPLFFFPFFCCFWGVCLCNVRVPRGNPGKPKFSSLPRKPGCFWIPFLLMAGKKKTLCAFRVETAKRKIPIGVPHGAVGRVRGWGRTCARRCAMAMLGRAECHVLGRCQGHEIRGVSSSQIPSLLSECCLE